MPFGQFTIPGFNPYAPQIQIPANGMPVDPGVSGMPETAQPGLLGMFDPRTPQGNATLLNLGAGLLAGSSSGQGFGAIAGQALQGALAQRQKSIDDELQRVLLKAKIKEAGKKTKDDYAPVVDSSGKTIYAPVEDIGGKQVGTIGNQAKPSALVEAYEIARSQGFKGDILDFQEELSRRGVGAPFTQGEMGGAQGAFDRRSGGFDAKTTAEIEAEVQRRLAEAKATGTGQGQRQAEVEKRGANAVNVVSLIDEANNLIDTSTGSPGGKLIDTLAAGVGKSTKGAESIASLQSIQGQLIQALPRLEGPQGVQDLELYKQSAGQIADANVPRATRKAAIRTLRRIQQKYADQFNASQGGGGAQSAEDPLGIR